MPNPPYPLHWPNPSRAPFFSSRLPLPQSLLTPTPTCPTSLPSSPLLPRRPSLPLLHVTSPPRPYFLPLPRQRRPNWPRRVEFFGRRPGRRRSWREGAGVDGGATKVAHGRGGQRRLRRVKARAVSVPTWPNGRPSCHVGPCWRLSVLARLDPASSPCCATTARSESCPCRAATTRPDSQL